MLGVTRTSRVSVSVNVSSSLSFSAPIWTISISSPGPLHRRWEAPSQDVHYRSMMAKTPRSAMLSVRRPDGAPQPVVDGPAEAPVGHRHHGDGLEGWAVERAHHREQVGSRFL